MFKGRRIRFHLLRWNWQQLSWRLYIIVCLLATTVHSSFHMQNELHSFLRPTAFHPFKAATWSPGSYLSQVEIWMRLPGAEIWMRLPGAVPPGQLFKNISPWPENLWTAHSMYEGETEIGNLNKHSYSKGGGGGLEAQSVHWSIAILKLSQTYVTKFLIMAQLFSL